MDKRCIIICDSGVGGFGLLKRLSDCLKGEQFLYYADFDNLPYGEKGQEQLLKIAEENCKKFLPFCPKLIVFACNTLSTNSVGLQFFGGVEIIKVLPKVNNCGKGLLLCTEATANSPYVQALKKQNSSLDVLPMKGLAQEVERYIFCGEKIDLEERFSQVGRDYDFVSLGCTHYTVIKNDLEKIFPKSQFLSGEDDVFEKTVNFITTFDTPSNGGGISFVGNGSKNAKSLYYKGFLKI